MNSAVNLMFGSIIAVVLVLLLASVGIVNAANFMIVFSLTVAGGGLVFRHTSAKQKVRTRVIKTCLGATAGFLIGLAFVSITSQIREENCQASKGITLLCE